MSIKTFLRAAGSAVAMFAMLLLLLSQWAAREIFSAGEVAGANGLGSVMYMLTAGLTVGGLLIGTTSILLVIWLQRQVLQPLHRLTNFLEEMPRNERQNDLVDVARKDEIGALARGIVGFQRIWTEHRNALHRIEHLARHDALTGLPNRMFFDESLAQALGKADSSGGDASLLFIDVDHFKEINDTLGHTGGDTVLRRVANILRLACRGGDTVGRIGGDEFAIVLEGSSHCQAKKFAERLLEQFAAETDGAAAGVRVSIGVATYPRDGADLEQLRHNADLALYGAKVGGRGQVRSFRSEAGQQLVTSTPRPLPLIAELDDALTTGSFRLFYQPKACARSNKIESFEALVRWQHPSRGLIPPNDFIPAAERTGRIRKLTDWTLRQAVCDSAVLASEGQQTLVYVNISGRLLGDSSFIRSVLDITEGSRQSIGLEITETAVIHDPENALAHLHELAEAGIKIAIDDYGAGLSSLSYLKQLPADELKIDRAFISDLSRSHRDPLLVRSTIDLAHALGMKVTAEGVEEAASLALLRVMGCDFIQGYLIARPMPLDQLLAFLNEARNTIEIDFAAFARKV